MLDQNFKTIYEDNSKAVYNLCLQYLQNIEDAQEVAQEVFISVFQSQEKFKGDSLISTWIYRITINKCLDFLKAKKRKKRFGFIVSIFNSEESLGKYEPSDFNHPGVLYEDKEALQILFEHINALPDNQKTALILHKIEHKPQVEIAEIMELSPKAVESLIQRAKVNLSKKLNINEGN